MIFGPDLKIRKNGLQDGHTYSVQNITKYMGENLIRLRDP